MRTRVRYWPGWETTRAGRQAGGSSTAPASKDHRRCAVGPDRPIVNPDASIRRAQVMAKEKKEQEASTP
jgi:hypothetical protein